MTLWTPIAFADGDTAQLKQDFSNHFIFSRNEIDNRAEFKLVKLQDYYFYHGPQLPVAHHLAGNGFEVCFLGLGVDSDGHFMNAKRLSKIVSRFSNFEDLSEYLTMVAGRYAFYLTNGELSRFYVDPTAMLGLVYNKTEQVLASIVTLSVSSPLQPANEYPLWEVAAYPRGARFAFGFTADRRATQQTPNHYLDLKDWTETRHWPKLDQDFQCYSMADVHASVDIVHNRHVEIISALVKNKKVAIPITGGQDSRVLLAYAQSCKNDVALFYTHQTNSNTFSDTNIAKKLCKLMEVPHEAYVIVNNIKQFLPAKPFHELHLRSLVRRGYQIGTEDLTLSKLQKREIAAHMAVPSDMVILRGHVTDISKAVLWRAIGLRAYNKNPNGPIDTVRALILMQLRPNALGGAQGIPSVDAHYETWVAGLPKNVHPRSVDFMGIEQYRSYTLGKSFYQYDEHFYMAPGNDRQIIAALIRLPPHMRASLHVNDLMLEKAAPSLKDVEYVRQADNALRQTRAPIEKYLDV